MDKEKQNKCNLIEREEQTSENKENCTIKNRYHNLHVIVKILLAQYIQHQNKIVG